MDFIINPKQIGAGVENKESFQMKKLIVRRSPPSNYLAFLTKIDLSDKEDREKVKPPNTGRANKSHSKKKTFTGTIKSGLVEKKS